MYIYICIIADKQCFEGTLLPPASFPGGEQNFEAMGKFAYFDSVAGSMMCVLMLMTGTNMSKFIVQGHQVPCMFVCVYIWIYVYVHMCICF